MNKNKLLSLCRKTSENSNITLNVALTYYFLESILDKISQSSYKEKFIFKGGFLLSNIIGIENRTTTDIDCMIDRINMEERQLITIFSEILIDDTIKYALSKISKIKENDLYGGYRLTILCIFENIRKTIHLDIATGDPITPKSIEYGYKSIFSNQKYSILAYNIETMMAEKLETIFKRSIFNSRSKDFYDIYVLYHLKMNEINLNNLEQACKNTFRHRNTRFELYEFKDLLLELNAGSKLQEHWLNYQKQYDYVKGITLSEVLDCCEAIIDQLISLKN